MTSVALVGCGDHGARVLLPVLGALGVRIAGVHDVDARRAEAVATQWAARRLASVTNALEAADGIVCALPGPAHHDVVQEALAADRDVFVEKPPAMSLRQVEDLMGRERDSAARCTVGLNFRFSDGVQELRRIVSSGEYGGPVHVRVVHLARKPRRTLWGEPLDHSLFFAQGIHAIDLGHLFIGDAQVAAAHRLSVEIGVAIAATLTGRDGTRAEIIVGSCASALRHHVEVFTSSGAVLSLTDLSEITVMPGGATGRWRDASQGRCVAWRRSPLATGHRTAGYEGEIAAFVAGVTEGRCNVAASLADAARTFRTFDAMLERANGRPS